MKYIVLLSVLISFSSCNKIPGFAATGPSLPYDLPPNAPIPPVKYCFVDLNINGSKMELTIQGDSVLGKISNQPAASLNGVIYGSTLIMNYRFKTDSGFRNQEEEWKLLHDTLYQVDQSIIDDSTHISRKSGRPVGYSKVFKKVACN